MEVIEDEYLILVKPSPLLVGIWAFGEMEDPKWAG